MSYEISTDRSVIHRLPPIYYQRVEPKRLSDAYLLAIFLGYFGAHHFYLGRHGFGLLYLCTFGLLGVGWIVDLCRMPCLVRETNRLRVGWSSAITRHEPRYRTRKIVEAYLLWLPPFGILGFHHFYLKRTNTFLLYMFTFGLMGVGWLADTVRMYKLVQEANDQLSEEQTLGGATACKYKTLHDAYVFGLSPFGLLGLHHFYMRRYLFGLLYIFTLGYLGLGWIADWIRMSVLVRRANRQEREEEPRERLYADDAYLLWLPPFGLLGIHHYYMRRPYWGILYTMTLGFLSVGWLVDLFRIPSLVKSRNKVLQFDQYPHDDERSPITRNNGDILPAAARQPNYDTTAEFYPESPPSYDYSTSVEYSSCNDTYRSKPTTLKHAD